MHNVWRSTTFVSTMSAENQSQSSCSLIASPITFNIDAISEHREANVRAACVRVRLSVCAICVYLNTYGGMYARVWRARAQSSTFEATISLWSHFSERLQLGPSPLPNCGTRVTTSKPRVNHFLALNPTFMALPGPEFCADSKNHTIMVEFRFGRKLPTKRRCAQ
jgi:hypothetical protein